MFSKSLIFMFLLSLIPNEKYLTEIYQQITAIPPDEAAIGVEDYQVYNSDLNSDYSDTNQPPDNNYNDYYSASNPSNDKVINFKKIQLFYNVLYKSFLITNIKEI